MASLREQPPPDPPIAGWYDDPLGSGKLRHWDGAAWTSRVTSSSTSLATNEDGKAVEIATSPQPSAFARKVYETADRVRAADLRPDIADARRQMRRAWGGRREIRTLEEHLWPDEAVEQMAKGAYGGG